MKPKINIYEIITKQIEELLNQGIIPWSKPWKNAGVIDQNLISKKAYRGINAFLLPMRRFSSPYWLTFNQAKQIGATVKKGEKGTQVIFWKMLHKKSKINENDQNMIPILKYYTIFNVDQCDNIPEGKILVIEELTEEDFNPIEAAETLINNYPISPMIKHGGDRATYNPTLDLVKMPNKEQFDIPENYYTTLFHELGHSTGHKKRCNRKEGMENIMFGSPRYAREELVAEMTAAFLSGVCGIEQTTINQNAAYIQNWLKELKNDRKLVVVAAAAAQKAADFVQGIEYNNQERNLSKKAA
jgi:antirestriction protein ArdC